MPEANRVSTPPHGQSNTPDEPRVRAPISGVVGRLAFAQILGTLTALITGPLQARALGPDGRGLLAAVTVPLTLLPLLANLGLGVYTSRAAARGVAIGRLTASVAGTLVAVGLLIALAATPLAALLGHQSDTAETFLWVGFLCAPLFLFGYFLWALNQGLERWTPLVWYRLVVPIGGTAAIVCLYALDDLTLAAACAVFLAGSLLSIIPLLGALRAVQRLRFDAAMAREAVAFGLPAWVGQLAYHANISLDQLLMIRLVDSRELGLYVVAATVAYFSTAITGPLQVAIVPRSARGDAELVVRACRSILWLVAALSVVVAALAPVFIPLLFGDDFSDAVPMIWILLAAGLPLTGTMVLGASLSAAGRPGSTARGELLALTFMIPALFVFLPTWGGIAAAVISLVAYSINFGVQLVASKRVFGEPLSSYLLIRRADVRWLYGRLRTLLQRRRTTDAHSGS